MSAGTADERCRGKPCQGTGFECLEKNGKISINFIFQSTKGEKYRVYRRGANTMKYTRLADVVATGKTCTYKDYKISTNHIYYYTVRRVYNKNKSLSQFDAVGIKGISFDTKPSVALSTTDAKISFATTPEAEEYIVYRSLSNGSYQQLKKLTGKNAGRLEWTDVFADSVTAAAEKKFLINGNYIDPTANPFRYEVRAIYRDTKKGYISRSLYYQNGACTVPTPAISSVSVKAGKATLNWAGIPVAKSYNIYAKTSKNAAWNKLAVVKSTGSELEKATFAVKKNYTFFTVKAFADVRGTLAASDFEKEFYIGKRVLSDKRALFIGDSLCAGKKHFSFSVRVEQMLGIQCDNIAIPTATLADATEKYKYSVLVDELEPLYNGKYPNMPEHIASPLGLSAMWEYDYIFIQGGTNDYAANVALGAYDSEDITTFNGAVNAIKHIIASLNEMRSRRGLEDVKLVIMDIPYSLRSDTDYSIKCRQTSPNKIGLTASDYSDAFIKKMTDSEWNVQLVNTQTVLNENNCTTESLDNLHFTKLGSAKVGKLIADVILYNL